jgi:hypothetical protein
MDILRTAYPRFYAGREAPDPVKTLNLWAEMFAEDDVKLVAAAVKSLIASDEKGYPPTIGAVKASLRQITTPQRMTAGDAWTLVSKAIRNSAYDSQEEFQRLPEDVQRIVGSSTQLREWAMMDSDTVHSVVASNFQRAYKARADSEAREAAIPADVKRLMAVYRPLELEDGK